MGWETIVLGLCILVSAVLFIIYFSWPERKSRDDTMDIQLRGEPKMSNKKEFDKDYHKGIVQDIREEDNVIKTGIKAVITRVKGTHERSVMDEKAKEYRKMQEVAEAQKGAAKAVMEAEETTTEYIRTTTEGHKENIGKRKDTTVIIDIKQQEAEIMDAELRIAEAKAKIAEAEARSKEAKEGKKTEPQEERKKPTPEEVRERIQKRARTEYEDMIAGAKTANEALTLVDIYEKEEEMKIIEMRLSPEDEKEQIRRMKIVFSKLRLDITKKYGQGRT